jgi:molybdopterin-guanine dinucleotide biosynthesis protein B
MSKFRETESGCQAVTNRFCVQLDIVYFSTYLHTKNRLPTGSGILKVIWSQGHNFFNLQLKRCVAMTPVISIVGKSKSGKTTLIEKLIPELKKRGYRVGTIKHASHNFDMDKKGKDSWRHKAAGADTVIVASRERIVMVKDENFVKLENIEKYFDDVDLVITEGFKKENKPKIEVYRSPKNQKPLCDDDNTFIAMVTDTDIRVNVPTFGPEEIEALSDLIEQKYL